MSIFKNQNFVKQIIKSQGGSEYFDEDSELIIQTLIELQTRKLVQIAAKFMRQAKRNNMIRQDLDQALIHMDHNDIILTQQKPQYTHQNSQYVLKDPIYKTPTDFINEQLKHFNKIFQPPKIKGRWIYIANKIPKINDNYSLKSLADLKNIQKHQFEEKTKIFNIIRDQPELQLTQQQLDYYNEITSILTSQNTKSFKNQVKGNIASLVPLLLKFIINIELNDCSITYLIKMLQNKFVWKNIETHLHQILVLLLSYQGIYSFEVGIMVGQIVYKFCEKYSILDDIYEKVPNNYSNMMKKIAFELTAGVAVKIDINFLQQCKKASEENNLIAVLCMNIILTYWNRIHCLRQLSNPEKYGNIYWHPTKQMYDDCYMIMY